MGTDRLWRLRKQGSPSVSEGNEDSSGCLHCPSSATSATTPTRWGGCDVMAHFTAGVGENDDVVRRWCATSSLRSASSWTRRRTPPAQEPRIISSGLLRDGNRRDSDGRRAGHRRKSPQSPKPAPDTYLQHLRHGKVAAVGHLTISGCSTGADSIGISPRSFYGHGTTAPASILSSVASVKRSSGGSRPYTWLPSLRAVAANRLRSSAEHRTPYCLSMPLHIPTKSGKVLRVVATLMTSISGIRSPSIAANVAIR